MTTARSYFYLASVVSLIVLPKTLIWNKITFPASNWLDSAELVENELMTSISKNIANIMDVLCYYSLLYANFLLLYIYKSGSQTRVQGSTKERRVTFVKRHASNVARSDCDEP